MEFMSDASHSYRRGPCLYIGRTLGRIHRSVRSSTKPLEVSVRPSVIEGHRLLLACHSVHKSNEVAATQPWLLIKVQGPSRSRYSEASPSYSV